MSALVGVGGPGGVIVGSGFVVGPSLVLTCAHVVNLALGASPESTSRPADDSRIELHFGASPGEVRTAHVKPVPEAWSPPPASQTAGADLCLLSVLGGLPDAVTEARLAKLRFEGPFDVRVSGYPADWNRKPGVAELDYATATLLGEVGYLWMLRSDPATRAAAQRSGHRPAGLVHRGFSGGPADLDGVVIGMVVEARTEMREATAYIIPCQHFPPSIRVAELPRKAVPRHRGQARHYREYAAPFLAPPLPVYYTTRVIEDSVLKMLGDDAGCASSILTISAVHGLGGIGKTTLAAAIAHTDFVKSYFPDGVLWAKLGRQPQVLPQLTAWVIALGEQATGTWTVESATAYLRLTLRDLATLIVVDDVWEEQDLSHFLVGGPMCRVLVTTRRAQVFDRYGAAVIDLGAMTRTEAQELFSKRSSARRRGSGAFAQINYDDVAAELGDLGGHPLAIELIGALGARDYTSADIKQQIQAYKRERLGSGERSSTLTAPIEACIGISFDILRRESGASWTILLWLSLLSRQSGFGEGLVAAALDIGLAQARQHLLLLADNSLVTRDRDVFRLHDLVRDTAARLLVAEPPEGLGIDAREAHRVIVGNIKLGKADWDWEELSRRTDLHNNLTWHLTEGGLVDELISLTTASDGVGRNAWYTLRRDAGETSSYLAELENVNRELRVLGSQGAGRNALFSLCRSSVLTLESAIPEELFRMVVATRVWTPLRAYQWASQHPNEQLRPAMLVALVAGLERVLSANEQESANDQRLKQMAISEALSLIFRLKPDQRSTKLLGYLINCISSSEKETLLEQIVAWRPDPAALYIFLKNVPAEVRDAFANLWSQQLSTIPANSGNIYWIAKMVPLFSVKHQAIWSNELINKLAETLDPLFCELSISTNGSSSPLPSLPSDRGAKTKPATEPRDCWLSRLMQRMFSRERPK